MSSRLISTLDSSLKAKYSTDTVTKNMTSVTEFTFLEFQDLPLLNPLLFVFFLITYALTLIGNLLIVVLVANDSRLKSPMYFFLSQLAISDVFLTTNITPNMLHIIINRGSSISIPGCIAQMYFYGVSATAECLLLVVMSYDRYLAICHPLRYTSIMEPRFQTNMAVSSWFLGFLLMLVFVGPICNLRFCGPHTIDHYFCDIAPFLELSCSDYTVLKLLNFLSTLLIAMFPFGFILYTYVSILISILGIPSRGGRQKAFSTCSSHLIVVSTYYGTLITTYIIPAKERTFKVTKFTTLLYTTGTPLFNPNIYSLRNNDIKLALINCMTRCLKK